MAKKHVDEAVPAPVLALARELGVPDPDWYVASAESGRGSGAFVALERAEQAKQQKEEDPGGKKP
jgi:hypothetical protein